MRSGAYTGDSAIVNRDLDGSIAGFDMVFRAERSEPQFVQYALLSQYLLKNQILLKRDRAAQPHLNAEELGGCHFLCPPKEEQREIAVFLDRLALSWERAVRDGEKMINLLKERRAALISAAVTGKIDVRGEVDAKEQEAA